MLGAIIGDMAADLWQRDKTKFYRQLIDEKISLSEYGKAVVIFAPKGMQCESINNIIHL